MIHVRSIQVCSIHVCPIHERLLDMRGQSASGFGAVNGQGGYLRPKPRAQSGVKGKARSVELAFRGDESGGVGKLEVVFVGNYFSGGEW